MDELSKISIEILPEMGNQAKLFKKFNQSINSYSEQQQILFNFIKEAYNKSDIKFKNEDVIYSRELVNVVLVDIKENIDKIQASFSPSSSQTAGLKRKKQGTKYNYFKKKLRKTKKIKKTKKNQSKKIIRRVSHKFTKKTI